MFVNWYLLFMRESSTPVNNDIDVFELDASHKAVTKVSEEGLKMLTSVLMCRHADGTKETAMPDYLETAIFKLMIMHMAVFLMNIAARCIMAHSVKNFSFHLLYLVAVPFYIVVLMEGYFAVVNTEANAML